MTDSSSNSSSFPAAVSTFYAENRDQHLAELTEFLTIPSISTLDAHKADVRRAADVVVAKLQEIGIDNARIVEGEPGENPLIVGDFDGVPGAPTVLVYAHYDVQPVDPLHLWVTGPFEPSVRDGMLYARGAADDKGQLWIVLAALEGLLRTTGTLPVNVKVLFEGEEESGGDHIARFVREKAEYLEGVTSVLVLDSGFYADGLPTITTGLRGIICGEIDVTTLSGDQHSGEEGGVAPNAVEALGRIIASLKTPGGKIRIPGVYDDVVRPSADELAAWRALPFSDDEHRRVLGAKHLVGNKRFTPLERMWALPTLEINGVAGGFAGDGFKTVIPAHAIAKVSMRLVPGMDPEKTAAALVSFVGKITPKWAHSKVTILSHCPPVLVETSSSAVQAAISAFRETFNSDVAYMRCGGSIPIAETFQTHLGVPVVITGFTQPHCNMHAPNECMRLENFFGGIEAVGRYLHHLSIP